MESYSIQISIKRNILIGISDHGRDILTKLLISTKDQRDCTGVCFIYWNDNYNWMIILQVHIYRQPFFLSKLDGSLWALHE